jgi:uncharacterized protein (DUF58 family)
LRRLVYASLRNFSALQRALRERLTVAGWIVLVAACVTAVAGVDTSQTVAYQAFTLSAALIFAAAAASGLFRARAVAERDLPRYATAGEPFSYGVTLTNLGARPLAGAALAEQLADPRPGYAEWRAAREPGEERRNWFDREMGFFRWRWLIERRLPEPQRAAEVPPLAPGERVTLRLTLEPRRRGRIELAGFTLSRPDPLGLVRGLRRLPRPGRVVALPKRYRLPPIALPGKRKFQQGGVTLASSVGDSEEFLGLRDYRPGDPLQHVHWKSFARIGKPIVKEYQDEFFERHALVLDTATARGEDAAFEEAVALAASFVYTINTQECLLDLLFVGGEVRLYTAGRGQLHADHMLEILAGVAPSPPASFEALGRAVLGQRGRLSSCILVLIDWDEARRELVRSLGAGGMEVRTLLVCEPARAPAEPPRGVLVLQPGRIAEGLAALR